MNIFLQQSIEKSPEKIFQELQMDHIDQKNDGTDQGYQSHQLLNESDVKRRQTMSLKKGATRCHEKSPKKNAQLLEFSKNDKTSNKNKISFNICAFF